MSATDLNPIEVMALPPAGLWHRPGFRRFRRHMLAVTSFNFVGDGLRDALDPRMAMD